MGWKAWDRWSTNNGHSQKDLPLTTYKRNGYCKYPGKDLNFLEVDSEIYKNERKVTKQ